MYVPPLSITIVRPWFATIRYSGEIGAKKTLKKSFLPPRWRLLMAQIIQCLGEKISGHDQISNKNAIIMYCLANRVKANYAKLIWEDIIHKLNKKTRKKGKKFGAKSRPRRKQSLKHTFESKTEASKSKTGQSDKETQSSSTKDKIISHPSPSTPVVGEMHKETQQANGGPTSLEATSEEGAHPQLSSDKTKSTRDGLKTSYTNLVTNEESKSDEISKKIKLEELSDLMKDTRYAFFTPDSSQDEPIIVSDESEEVETKKDEDTHDTSYDVPKDTLVSHPPSPKLAQIQELMVQVSNTLTKFASIMENASYTATSKGVPSVGPATASPTEGEKNTNPATKDAKTTNLHNESVDLLSIDLVT
nr:hypothetical protein [Tanacetum cinerariifolium]